MFTLHIDLSSPERGGLAGLQAALSAGAVSPRDLNDVVGRAGAELTRSHLYGLANARHRQHVGLNFYEDAADATTHEDVGDAAQIRIDKSGMAQRFHGGKIRAVNYSHLWIPIAPESEGKSAAEFSGLIPLISPLTNRGVAILHEKGKKLQDEKALFALVPEVDQAPDPSVLPTEDEYLTAAESAADELLHARGIT